MAESIKATGKILEDGKHFEFSMDGMATYNQLERLIKLTAQTTDKITKGKSELAKAEKEHLDNLNDINKADKDLLDNKDKEKKQNKDLKDKIYDLSNATSFLKGNFQSALYGVNSFTTAITTGAGALIGSLFGYADQLQLGLQRGVSGGIMDFAIAAKTGGVSLGTFSKALEESGGAFASLGDGATDGAKNFGSLISSVRTATASVGNMGLSNDQLAAFTAQQVKVAVSQGFKGKVAQDVVINNSRALGKELDTLANRTGKSVLEMAQAAIKLAQDPVVSSFVRDVKVGGADAAKALNSYAASFKALFGEQGDKLARDTIGPALSGLPMIVNETGKSLALASQSTYNEIDRLAQKARRKEEMTDEDRKRLSATIKSEVAARGEELRYRAELGGPLGESAKQFLALADEVEKYNSEDGIKRRKQDEAALQFNSAVNQFKANLQALAIPFLNLVNGIDWTVFIKTLSLFAAGLEFVLHVLDPIGKFLGMGPGGLAGAILGLVAVIAIGKSGYGVLNKAVTSTAAVFTEASMKIKLAADRALGFGASGKLGKTVQAGSLATAITLDSMAGAPTSRIGKGMAAGGVAGGIGGMMGGGLGEMGGEYVSKKMGVSSNTGGAIGGTTGALAGGIAGAAIAGGLTVGTGGLAAAVAPAIITGMSALGGFLGNVVGNTIGDWMSDENADSLPAQGADAVGKQVEMGKAQLEATKQQTAELKLMNEGMGYNVSLAARQISATESGNRTLSNMSLAQG